MFKTARLELTGTCDIRCLYCHAGEKNTACRIEQELSHQRWLEIIDECRRLGVTTIILTGGELFLYKRWPEIIEACGTDVRVVLSTNSRHLSRENLALLSDYPQVQEIRTSLDGLEVNDIIREGSSYKKTIETLFRTKAALPQLKVMIQTVVYQQNLKDILLLYPILKDLGIYRWRLSQLWKTIRTERNQHILDFSEYELMFSLYAEIIQRHQKDQRPFLLSIDNVYYSWIDTEDYASMSLSGHPCAYNFDFLCVNANGDLVFCPALNLPYASVKELSIAEATANSEWLNDFKQITVDSLGCGSCRYIKICGSGCRADSHRWLGAIKAIDPNSCCMMPMIEKVILPLLGEGEQRAYRTLIDESGNFPTITGRNIEEAVRSIEKGGS